MSPPGHFHTIYINDIIPICMHVIFKHKNDTLNPVDTFPLVYSGAEFDLSINVYDVIQPYFRAFRYVPQVKRCINVRFLLRSTGSMIKHRKVGR